MAHSKSALKRWRQSLARRDRNRSFKSQTRTLLNKAAAAIASDPANAEQAVRAAVSALDEAAQKNIIHDNAAARGKSRLLKRFNLATASVVASAATASADAPAKKPAAKARGAAAAKPAATRKRSTAKKDDAKADAKPAARRTRKTT